jgi:ADP-heptose:LPS heptosyltransferase
VPTKLIIRHLISAGDILMTSAVIRDIHRAHPGRYLTDVRVSYPAIFENSPYITRIDDDDPEATWIDSRYWAQMLSHTGKRHFIEALHEYFELVLGAPIPPGPRHGDLHLSSKEMIPPKLPARKGYWLIVNGGKNDFTVKPADPFHLQDAVSRLGDIDFVQVGELREGHVHRRLIGPNVIDMLGKTTLRELIYLCAHCEGVLCPDTFLIHCAAALCKKCVCIGGGRVPESWLKYPRQTFLSAIGKLPCCEKMACWRSRTVALQDGRDGDDRLCSLPIIKNGLAIPKCMDIISADEIVLAMRESADL